MKYGGISCCGVSKTAPSVAVLYWSFDNGLKYLCCLLITYSPLFVPDCGSRAAAWTRCNDVVRSIASCHCSSGCAPVGLVSGHSCCCLLYVHSLMHTVLPNVVVKWSVIISGLVGIARSLAAGRVFVYWRKQHLSFLLLISLYLTVER